VISLLSTACRFLGHLARLLIQRGAGCAFWSGRRVGTGALPGLAEGRVCGDLRPTSSLAAGSIEASVMRAVCWYDENQHLKQTGASRNAA
jgi:hypothetical protein